MHHDDERTFASKVIDQELEEGIDRESLTGMSKTIHLTKNFLSIIHTS